MRGVSGGGAGVAFPLVCCFGRDDGVLVDSETRPSLAQLYLVVVSHIGLWMWPASKSIVGAAPRFQSRFCWHSHTVDQTANCGVQAQRSTFNVRSTTLCIPFNTARATQRCQFHFFFGGLAWHPTSQNNRPASLCHTCICLYVRRHEGHDPCGLCSGQRSIIDQQARSMMADCQGSIICTLYRYSNLSSPPPPNLSPARRPLLMNVATFRGIKKTQPEWKTNTSDR